jgi:hypothetical protein
LEVIIVNGLKITMFLFFFTLLMVSMDRALGGKPGMARLGW